MRLLPLESFRIPQLPLFLSKLLIKASTMNMFQKRSIIFSRISLKMRWFSMIFRMSFRFVPMPSVTCGSSTMTPASEVVFQERKFFPGVSFS